MSYSWTCEGSGFSAFKWALEVAGVPTEPIWLGEHSDEAISFTAADGRRMVAEDYLSVDDGDCDGTSRYEFVLYEEGQRPELMREVRCGGGSFGSEYSLPEGEPLDHFEFRINDGAIFPCPGYCGFGCGPFDDDDDELDDFSGEEDEEQDLEDLDF